MWLTLKYWISVDLNNDTVRDINNELKNYIYIVKLNLNLATSPDSLQKKKKYLFTLHLFQTCMRFFLLLNTKYCILVTFAHTKDVSYHQLFGYQHSSKYLLLCTAEVRNSNRFI